MNKTKKINLTVSEEIKDLAKLKAKEMNLSISNLFSQLIKNEKIIDFDSIDTDTVTKISTLLNTTEQHLYQIKKIMFETFEKNKNLKNQFYNLKQFIEKWNRNINKQIHEVYNFIGQLNQIKKEIINL